MINDRFITYFRETFFEWKEEEFQDFLTSIEKSIPRTIRIKSGMEQQVKQNLESDGWILTPTHIDRVYSMDRREDFDPFERRLGFSLDHLVGNFYIQELAAAHPVDILADSQVSDKEFLILDLAASPGGKTTQLAEYYPNSFIIANEPTRERIPQLLQNLDRMRTPNVGVTLYPGQYWKHLGETFDRILLDAPCSGEGTLYKWTDAVKHWHLKNIKEISRLQTKLLDASLHALKVGGEMIYSTCALNLLENEWVVDAMYEKYGHAFEILFQKKFWPHIDGTGGFFITKIRKTRSLPTEGDGEKRGGTNEKLKVYRGNISPWKLKEWYKLYEHDKKILAVKSTWHALEDIYFMRYGEQIGTIENGRFEANTLSYRFLDVEWVPHHILSTEEDLDAYLRGSPLTSEGPDAYILISHKWQIISMEKREDTMIKNTFPKDWRRK
jgi:16S rRNA C967 or C1407 C5-methylase (RsmB/RsmF family)/NOL1/NOP2/fmu family ribosome biogenesis protein